MTDEKLSQVSMAWSSGVAPDAAMASRNARSEPSALAAWTAEDRIPDEMIARVERHPNFTAAARALSRNMLDAASEDARLDGIVKDLGRYFATGCALYLDVTGGLTLPRLKELCAQSGFLSPGRARAMLLYLQFLGYVDFLPQPQRQGAGRYRPTAALVDAWRLHLRAGLQAAALIEPAANAILPRLGQDHVLNVYLEFVGAGFLVAAGATKQQPSLLLKFYERHAASQLIHCLLMSVPQGDVFPPREPIKVSIAATARRLRVSRVQIRRLLRGANQDGLIDIAADGAVVLTPATRTMLRYLFAGRLIGFLICAAKTEARLDGAPD